MKVIGLDVSKASVEAWCQSEGLHYSFSLAELEKAVEVFKSCQPDLIIMESTGQYEQPWFEACREVGLPAVVEHAARIHYHAKALGKQAKTDKLDAKIIAHYGQTYSERLLRQSEQKVQRNELKALVERREDLLKQQTAEKNRLKQCREAVVQKSIARLLKFLGQLLAQIEKAIEAHIEQEDLLKQQALLLQSAPGIGAKTSWSLLACLPELGLASSKAIAALAGVAPFQQESGTWRGRSCIRGGRPQVRKALYMGCLSAVRHCETFKAFYDKLLAKGKPKKVALVACIHKMLRILNAMLAQNKPFTTTT